MTDVSTWNAVDDSNNAAAPAGWPEGMMPSGVNNAARAMQGALKRWRDQSQPTVTATGSGNAQIITYPVAPAALASGDTFAFFALANTGPATLQVNAQAAKPIQTSTGTALIGGEMPAGAAVMVVYDGANFRMLAAPTPLSISNGGTGQTTPAAAADAIGAVKDTGDTMTGTLTVPGIIYSGNPHTVSFGWDGAQTHVYIDGADQGPIGDIASVSAGNGLTGGGTSGALSLAMSGSYSGNFTATGNVNAGNVNAGNFTATGSVNGAYVSSTGNINATGNISCVAGYQIGGVGVIDGARNFTGGNVTASGTINVSGVLSTGTDVNIGHDLNVSNGHITAFFVVPIGDNQGAVGAGGNGYNAVYSHNFVTVSDAAVKEGVETPPPGLLDLVGAVSPRTYRLSGALNPEIRHWGFVAQEVGKVMSDAGREFGGWVVDKESGRQGLVYHELVAVLWGAVTELAARVKALETR